MPMPDARTMRRTLKRSAQAHLVLAAGRDPIGVLERQHQGRIPDLVPVRVERMLRSPFAFYRGSAAVMASDLAHAPVTGVRVVACGDAHVANLGFFASPERRLLFDLNDFDEGGVAPWEWDLKRLATSVVLAGRDAGHAEAACVAATIETVRGYRTWLTELMGRSALERFHVHADVDALARLITHDSDRDVVRRAAGKARRRTSDQAFEDVTERTSDGGLRIVERPPVTRRLSPRATAFLEPMYEAYRATLREDVRLLLAGFRIVDAVLRVVGVGSVGTRCYLVLLKGPGDEPLFLQAKEAQPSVLVSHGGMRMVIPGAPRSAVASEGHRVVAAQRILQAHSDPFLGWVRGFAGAGPGRRPADFYVRQYRDMKGAIDATRLDASQLGRYGYACGALLARAHGQSPAARAIADYLGDSEPFDEAIAAWAGAYADVCESDHRALREAVASGRMPVPRGVCPDR